MLFRNIAAEFFDLADSEREDEGINFEGVGRFDNAVVSFDMGRLPFGFWGGIDCGRDCKCHIIVHRQTGSCAISVKLVLTFYFVGPPPMIREGDLAFEEVAALRALDFVCALMGVL